jgi:hypothetical protein
MVAGGEHQPISPDLRAAFDDALADYHAWRPGEGESSISLDGTSYTISSVCDFVKNYEDLLIAVNIAKLPSVPRQILKDIPRPPNSVSRGD